MMNVDFDDNFDDPELDEILSTLPFPELSIEDVEDEIEPDINTEDVTDSAASLVQVSWGRRVV